MKNKDFYLQIIIMIIINVRNNLHKIMIIRSKILNSIFRKADKKGEVCKVVKILSNRITSVWSELDMLSLFPMPFFWH